MARQSLLTLAGIALLGFGLWGLLFPGLDIATRGISSTQPLFNPGLPVRLLPLAAFLAGVVAGGGLLARARWALWAAVAHAALLALSAPLWAQQLALGFYVYTSQPPALLPVALLCLGAVALLVAAVLLARLPAVIALFPAPDPARIRAFPWRPALAAGLLAGAHFALTMYVEYCLRTTPLQTGVPPPPLPALAAAAFPCTQLLAMGVSDAARVPVFLGQSALFGLLTVAGAALLLRLPLPRRCAARRPASRLLLWPLAAAATVVLLALLLPAAFFLRFLPSTRVELASRDYATAPQRIAALRAHSAVAPLAKMADTAFIMHRWVNALGPDSYDSRIAVQGTPGDVAAWARRQRREDGAWTGDDGPEFLAALGANWPVASVPADYRTEAGRARVYAREGVILLELRH